MQIGITQQEKISKKVLDLIDFIEIKTLTWENWTFFRKFNKPFSFHLQDLFQRKWLNLADPDFPTLMAKKETQKIIKPSFPWISFHTGFPVTKWNVKDHTAVALTKPISRRNFKKKFNINISCFKKHYPKLDILMESPPFVPDKFSKGAYKFVCDPDFISEVVNENRVLLILDIAHSLVSAMNLGFGNLANYLTKLPLQRVREIHLSRSIFSQERGYWFDCHLPISRVEIKYLKFALSRTKNVKAITLEAQGLHDDKTLIKELKMIREIL